MHEFCKGSARLQDAGYAVYTSVLLTEKDAAFAVIFNIAFVEQDTGVSGHLYLESVVSAPVVTGADTLVSSGLYLHDISGRYIVCTLQRDGEWQTVMDEDTKRALLPDGHTL